MINEHVYTQSNLFLASERFELVAKATHDVIWDWDLVKNTVWWNEGMQLIFGYEEKDLEPGPDSWYSRIHPDDQERVLRNIHNVIDNRGTNWADDYRFRRADGTYANVHDRGYTIIEGSMPVRLVGSMQDITEEVQARQAQLESDQRLTFALKSAQLGTWDLDLVNNKIEWDERCREFFGISQNESIVYEEVYKYIHREDKTRVNNAVRQAIDPSGDNNYDIKFRTVSADDQVLRWVHCKGQAYFKDGKAYRFSGIIQDITDQIADKERAYFADQQATMTIEGTGAGSFLVDISTDEIIYSPTTAKILTGEANTNISRSVMIDHLHPDDFHIRDQAYKLAAETGELSYEARFVWDDGSIHWVKFIARYLYDSNGKGVSLSGILFDISDRIESEQRLKESEEYLRSMIEQAPVATALFVGKEMIIEIPNEAMLKFWGKGNSITGKPLKEALPELIGQPFLQILDEVYDTGKTYQTLGVRADFIQENELKTFYFDFNYKPLLDKSGQVYAIMNVAADVTSRVVSEQELKESEERYRQLADELELRIQQRTNELRLANQELINSNNNLQQFAYAASHDMQEPLRKIQSFSSRLQEVYANSLDTNGLFMLNRMQDAAKRMSLMIDDLLTYSRLTTKKGEFVPVNLDPILSEVLSDLEVGIKEQEAEFEIHPMPVISGSHRQLVQLFQNLISNAVKYRLPDKAPKITITAKKTDLQELSGLSNIMRDHNYVRIDVTDNGIGFDEKYLERIFQMFQRLHGKGEFHGSGIGLALCKKVVQNHHGHITAKSSPGQGSTFMVYLPEPK